MSLPVTKYATANEEMEVFLARRKSTDFHRSTKKKAIIAIDFGIVQNLLLTNLKGKGSIGKPFARALQLSTKM